MDWTAIKDAFASPEVGAFPLMGVLVLFSIFSKDVDRSRVAIAFAALAAVFVRHFQFSIHDQYLSVFLLYYGVFRALKLSK
jgi:hypothetical protein